MLKKVTEIENSTQVEPKEKLYRNGCRFCGRDKRTLYAVPELTSEANLNASAWMCYDCGVKHDLICVKHNEAYSAFEWGHNICKSCFYEEVRALIPHRDMIVEVLKRYHDHPQVAILFDWADEWKYVFPVGETITRYLANRIIGAKANHDEVVELFYRLYHDDTLPFPALPWST